MQKPEKNKLQWHYGSKDCIHSKLITTEALHEHPLGDLPVVGGSQWERDPSFQFTFYSMHLGVSCHFIPPVHQQPGKTVDVAVRYSILAAYLQPHITGMSLQLFAKVFPGELVEIQDGVLPLNLLHTVWVMGHAVAQLHLFQSVPAAAIGLLKVEDELAQCAEDGCFVHEFLTSADAQCTIAAAKVHPQHDVSEVVPWEVRFEADGETVQCGHVVGEVTDSSHYSGNNQR